ncbi:transmembrane protein 222 [Cephus cinctus]|uniref:Transmembrane protein 222 n=1 Tax=Cephus cinctus TaxID=211228 RepID=A0AAJ7RF62_CEPCN|nr:transmembrane protein 222 [Cephus cinctus]XP_015593278.1 transmembrane protein 222 [Cephus cinctus]XP_024939822.1 transmembrane protein 222 [Cephus cinctus]
MKDNDVLSDTSSPIMDLTVDPVRKKFPFCIVWTPIPFLTYFFPFIGHMGIGTSSGIIRDFAGPYHVSEDNMAFGQPTRYLQLNYQNARGGIQGWDSAVAEASEKYKGRMHNLCLDNCHSHVATALELMNYKNQRWNMIKLACILFICGRFVSFCGAVKTFLPFLLIVTCITVLYLFL